MKVSKLIEELTEFAAHADVADLEVEFLIPGDSEGRIITGIACIGAKGGIVYLIGGIE